MLLKRKLPNNFFGWKVSCLLGMVFSFIGINNAFSQDSTRKYSNDSLHYPIHDRRGDFFSNQRSPFDLNTPSNITDSIGYDPATKRFKISSEVPV